MRYAYRISFKRSFIHLSFVFLSFFAFSLRNRMRTPWIAEHPKMSGTLCWSGAACRTIAQNSRLSSSRIPLLFVSLASTVDHHNRLCIVWTIFSPRFLACVDSNRAYFYYRSYVKFLFSVCFELSIAIFRFKTNKNYKKVSFFWVNGFQRDTNLNVICDFILISAFYFVLFYIDGSILASWTGMPHLLKIHWFFLTFRNFRVTAIEKKK